MTEPARLTVRQGLDLEAVHAEAARALEDRLAALLEAHPGVDALRARRREALVQPCGVPSCQSKTTRPYPCGWRCEDHHPGGPRQEILQAGGPSWTPSTVRLPVPIRTYGTLTTDPAGRNGPGWTKDKRSRLPVWTGDGPEVRRP